MIASTVGCSRSTALRDVTLRDGLQDEAFVATADKLALFDAIVVSGVTDLELTSFVRPDRIPAMADAEALAHATAHSPVARWGLVLNARGAQRAIDSGLDRLQCVVSVSESHQTRNAGHGIEAFFADLDRIVEIAHSMPDRPVVIEVTLATAFGCPYEGAISTSAVLKLAERALAAGIDALSVADTIGTAVPPEVADLVASLSLFGVPIGAHLHDTRGLGIANALTAIESGIDRLDATVGGLGGCPFAPGASGNLALEDLVHCLEAMGVPTGIDLSALLDAASLACSLVGREVSSHVGIAGPRFVPLQTLTS